MSSHGTHRSPPIPNPKNSQSHIHCNNHGGTRNLWAAVVCRAALRRAGARAVSSSRALMQPSRFQASGCGGLGLGVSGFTV